MQLNLPDDFVTALQNKIGIEGTAQLIQSLNEPAAIGIRVNPEKKHDHISAGLAPIAWCSAGYYLDERPSFTLDPLFHAGAYYVQEPSSMFLEQFIIKCFDGHQKIKVLDLCAAPGGKSTHLLSLLQPESLLVSNEVIRPRAKILSENIQKWGHCNVIVTQNDPADFGAFAGFFDLIVVDAPCSGEGLFRKEPDALREWSMNNVQLCAQRQKRILSDIYPALKQNGVLIYCTCTYNSAENEETVTWLSAHHNVEFIQIPHASSWGVDEVNANGVIGYQLLPHQLRGEGFFISGIIKKNPESEIKISSKHRNHKVGKTVAPMRDLFRPGIELNFASMRDGIRFSPTHWRDEISLIEKNLNCVQVGTLAGQWKQGKFIPDHALALSTNLNMDNVLTIELNKDQAIRYLKKETFDLPDQNTRGHFLVVHGGVGLGWINQLENRHNNLYPTHWRIRLAG